MWQRRWAAEPVADAIAATSRTILLLPKPGGSIMSATHSSPLIASSGTVSSALISQVPQRVSIRCADAADDSRRLPAAWRRRVCRHFDMYQFRITEDQGVFNQSSRHHLTQPLRTDCKRQWPSNAATSADNTVTCLYSAGVCADVIGAPHSSQNSAIYRSTVRHESHVTRELLRVA